MVGAQLWEVDGGDEADGKAGTGLAVQLSPRTENLIRARRCKAQAGPDSRHHWQAVKLRKGRVVEMRHQKIIWLTVHRSAS